MRIKVLVACAVSVLLCLTGPAWAASHTPAKASLSAHGSADQVYATGLPARAKAKLVARDGHTVYSQRADSLGGLLFRNVRPGGGYRVVVLPHGPRSGPVTVHTTASAP